MFSIRESRAPGTRNEHGGSLRNSVDQSTVLPSLEAKPDPNAGSNAEFDVSLLAGRDEPMGVFAVSEQASGQGLESVRSAIRILPKHHFQQMDQLVFEDALEGFEPIATGDAGNADRAVIVFGEGLEKQRRGNRDFVILQAVRHTKPSRLTSGTGHARGDAEGNPLGTEMFTDMAGKERRVVQLEESSQVFRVKTAEVPLLHIAGLVQEIRVDRPSPLGSLGRR